MLNERENKVHLRKESVSGLILLVLLVHKSLGEENWGRIFRRSVECFLTERRVTITTLPRPATIVL